MGREINLFTLRLSITITVCFASISVEKQQKILKEYVIYLNSLPSQVYKYEAGEILKADRSLTYHKLSAASARKFHVLCEDCSGRINHRIPVVRDLTRLALNDPATHDPYTKHYLNDILEVDHQIDRSRYILILTVTSDNCSTSPSPFCKNVKTCRVSILENIQTNHANGSKYINAVSNNCTRTTDIPYVKDVYGMITDTTYLYDKTHNILTELYLDEDNFNVKPSVEKNLIEPHVINLVQKALAKYLQSVKYTHPHPVLKIENVTTQVSTGLMTRVTFIATASSTQYLKCSLYCQSNVWGQFWTRRKKHINVACQAVQTNSRFRRSVSKNGVTTPNDEAKALANKILKKYLKDRKVKVIYKVSKINKYVRIESLTSLDFETIPVKPKSKPNLMCNMVIKEVSQGKTETHVSCFEIKNPNLPVEDDPNAERFQDLMDASLQHYINTYKIKRKYSVLDRLIATEQVLKSKHNSVLVKVDFRAGPVFRKIRRIPQLLCHSEILVEGTQQKVKNINLTCVKLGKKMGEIVYENPDKQYFESLAKKSLKQYFKSHSIEQQYHKTEQIIVTKEVMKSKTITKIDFRAHADTDFITTHLLCHSEIESLKSREKINVRCYLVHSSSIFSMILAVTKSKSTDGNDYRTLADESLHKYIYTHHVKQFYIVEKINVLRDEKGKEAKHVKMTFVGMAAAKTAKDLICNSIITIYYSTKKKHFNVSCKSVEYEIGYVSPALDEDPNKPPFPDLAKKALKTFLGYDEEKFVVAERLIAIAELTILKYSYIRLTFRAVPTDEMKSTLAGLLFMVKMTSVRTFIFIACTFLGKNVGDLIYEDPNKPQFKKLADESLKLYLKSHKIRIDSYVNKVLYVTTKHARETNRTTMEFRAFFKDKPRRLMANHVHLLCRSEISEGHSKKNIEVLCRYVIYRKINDLQGLRQFAPNGGEVVKNPSDSRYKKLTKLSLKKWKNINDVHNYYV